MGWVYGATLFFISSCAFSSVLDKLLLQQVENQNIDAVQELLERGACVNARGLNGNTSLHKAAFQGNRHLIELLLKRGADVLLKGFFGFTPLHYAVAHEDIEAAQTLLERGANVNATDIHKQTCLHYAAQAENQFLIYLLLDFGADISVKNYLNQSPPDVSCHWQIFMISKVGYDQLKTLKDKRYLSSKHGRTPAVAVKRNRIRRDIIAIK